MRSKLTVLALILTIILTLGSIPLMARSIKQQSATPEKIFGHALPSNIKYINGFITDDGKFAQLQSIDEQIRIDVAMAATDQNCRENEVELAKIEESCLEPILRKFLLAQFDPKRSRNIKNMALTLNDKSITAISFELPDEHFYWLTQNRNSAQSTVILVHTRKHPLVSEEFQQILRALEL